MLIKFSSCQAKLICLLEVAAYIKGVVEGMGNEVLSFPGNTEKQSHSVTFRVPLDSLSYSTGGFLIEYALFKLIN